MRRAHLLTTTENDFFTDHPLVIPGGWLNNDVIARDVSTAQETFARLSQQVEERLQTIGDILNSAERVSAARAAQRAAEESAAAAAAATAAAAEETAAAAQHHIEVTESRVRELELMLQELGTGA